MSIVTKTGDQGGRDETRQGEVLPRRVAVQAADADRGQVEAGGGHELFLRSAFAADEQQSTIRRLSAKRLRDRERRIQVPAGSAASDQ